MGLDNMGARPKEQKPVPNPGMIVARNYQIVELGTHLKTFPGKEPKEIALVQLGWELPGVQHVFDENRGPQPLAVFQEYTASLDPKAKLAKDLKSWAGIAQFSPETKLKQWLGQPCMINIIHSLSKEPQLPVDKSIYKDGKMVYANVGSVVPLMEGVTCPPAINKPVYFDFDEFATIGAANWNNYYMLPEWMQKKISEMLWVMINGKKYTWTDLITTCPMLAKPESAQQSQAPSGFGASPIPTATSSGTPSGQNSSIAPF